jgi:hypothetical protein
MTDLDGQAREALKGLMKALVDYREGQNSTNSPNEGWDRVMDAYAVGRAVLAAREEPQLKNHCDECGATWSTHTYKCPICEEKKAQVAAREAPQTANTCEFVLWADHTWTSVGDPQRPLKTGEFIRALAAREDTGLRELQWRAFLAGYDTRNACLEGPLVEIFDRYLGHES